MFAIDVRVVHLDVLHRRSLLTLMKIEFSRFEPVYVKIPPLPPQQSAYLSSSSSSSCKPFGVFNVLQSDSDNSTDHSNHDKDQLRPRKRKLFKERHFAAGDALSVEIYHDRQQLDLVCHGRREDLCSSAVENELTMINTAEGESVSGFEEDTLARSSLSALLSLRAVRSVSLPLFFRNKGDFPLRAGCVKIVLRLYRIRPDVLFRAEYSVRSPARAASLRGEERVTTNGDKRKEEEKEESAMNLSPVRRYAERNSEFHPALQRTEIHIPAVDLLPKSIFLAPPIVASLSPSGRRASDDPYSLSARLVDKISTPVRAVRGSLDELPSRSELVSVPHGQEEDAAASDSYEEEWTNEKDTIEEEEGYDSVDEFVANFRGKTSLSLPARDDATVASVTSTPASVSSQNSRSTPKRRAISSANKKKSYSIYATSIPSGGRR